MESDSKNIGRWSVDNSLMYRLVNSTESEKIFFSKLETGELRCCFWSCSPDSSEEEKNMLRLGTSRALITN